MKPYYQHLLLGFIYLVLLGLPSFSQAQLTRLNDSASPRYQVESLRVTSETGEPLDQAVNPQIAIMDFGVVEYKLATAEFVGQRVKLYYVIPSTIKGLLNPKALTVHWESKALIQSGSAHAGERKLVWSGTLTQPWLEIALYLSMQVRLNELRLRTHEVFGFESYFELETLP